MDEGVAYMVMGEGGEMTQVTQPTQVVAIDQGDGTQQFAIPVIDPETGQVSCHWLSQGHVTTVLTSHWSGDLHDHRPRDRAQHHQRSRRGHGQRGRVRCSRGSKLNLTLTPKYFCHGQIS